MKSYTQLIQTVKEIFDHESFIHQPQGLYEPIDYTLHLGGKRLRPVMLMAANQMFGGDESRVRHAAIGIETFHNFTLLHDDLMDHSPIRRGQPTVYCKWDDNTAILSGDTMFALAWRYMLLEPHPDIQAILTTFNETAIGVCEGQQYDMEFETRSDVTIPEYMEMIRLKTAILLAGALKIGAQYAGAPQADIDLLYQYGIHTGLAFQLQDDLLDAFGDEQTFGKKTGSDIRDNKKTFLYLKALQIASPEQQALLRQHFSTRPADTADKVAEVLAIYHQIGVKALVEQEIESQFALAQQCLAQIHVPQESKTPLADLAKAMLGREK